MLLSVLFNAQPKARVLNEELVFVAFGVTDQKRSGLTRIGLFELAQFISTDTIISSQLTDKIVVRVQKTSK
ncbi:MAG: hypothetical protein CMJ78_23085 [Planctomycetaceae bacterium]|nr:hypothetical protein [Planctomycetaceae bacterium]